MSEKLDSVGKVTTAVSYRSFAEKSAIGTQDPEGSMLGYMSFYFHLFPTAAALNGHDRMRFALGKHWYSSDTSNYGFDFGTDVNPYLIDFAKDPLNKTTVGFSGPGGMAGEFEYMIFEEGTHPSPLEGPEQVVIIPPGQNGLFLKFKYPNIPEADRTKIIKEIYDFLITGRILSVPSLGLTTQPLDEVLAPPLIEEGRAFIDNSFRYQSPFSNIELNALGGSIPGTNFASITTEFSQNTKADNYINTIREASIHETKLPNIYNFKYWEADLASGPGNLASGIGPEPLPGLFTKGFDVDAIFRSHIYSNLSLNQKINLIQGIADVPGEEINTPLTGIGLYLNRYTTAILSEEEEVDTKFSNLGFSMTAYDELKPTELAVKAFPMHAKIEMTAPATPTDPSEAGWGYGSMQNAIKFFSPEMFPALTQVVMAGTAVVFDDFLPVGGDPSLPTTYNLDPYNIGRQGSYAPLDGGLAFVGSKFTAPLKVWNFQTLIESILTEYAGTPAPYVDPSTGELVNPYRPGTLVEDHDNHTIYLLEDTNFLEDYGFNSGPVQSGPGLGPPPSPLGGLAFFQQIAALDGYVRDYAQARMRSYKDIMEGKLANNEILLFRIEKQRLNDDGTFGTVQNIFLPNVSIEGNSNLLQYFDTQVHYDTYYRYRVFAYTIVVGTEYTYGDASFFSSQMGDQIDFTTTPGVVLPPDFTKPIDECVDGDEPCPDDSLGGSQGPSVGPPGTGTGTGPGMGGSGGTGGLNVVPIINFGSGEAAPPLDMAQYVPFKITIPEPAEDGSGLAQVSGFLSVDSPVPTLKVGEAGSIYTLPDDPNVYTDLPELETAYTSADFSKVLECPEGWQLIRITLEEDLPKSTWDNRSFGYSEVDLDIMGIGMDPEVYLEIEEGEDFPTLSTGVSYQFQATAQGALLSNGKILPSNCSTLIGQPSSEMPTYQPNIAGECSNPNIVYACARKPTSPNKYTPPACDDFGVITTVLAPSGVVGSTNVIADVCIISPLMTGLIPGIGQLPIGSPTGGGAVDGLGEPLVGSNPITPLTPDTMDPPMVSEVPQDTSEFDVGVGTFITLKPTVNFIEIPYFNTDGSNLNIVLDKPPLPPDVLFVPHPGRRNDVTFFLNRQAGRMELNPVEFGPEESVLYDKHRIAQGVLPGAPIIFENDNPNQSYLIYRSSTPPEGPSDMAQVGQTDTTFFDDVISSNVKYYYTFRSIDNRENISYPTAIFEVELVTLEDGNPAARVAVLPLFKEYVKPAPIPPLKKKSFRKYILIRPHVNDIDLGLEEFGVEDEADLEEVDLMLANPKLGGLFSPHDGGERQKFKLRLTSKSTGRKIDVNFSFTHRHNKPPKRSPGGRNVRGFNDQDVFNPEDY